MRLSSLIAILVSLLSISAWAGSVLQIKGNKMIIQLEGENPGIGDEYFIVSPEGKRIGLVSIKQIKGTKALADLTKGRANVGDTIKSRGAAASTSAPTNSHMQHAADESEEATTKPHGHHRAGFLAGYAMNTFSLTVQDKDTPALQESVTMKDNSFSLKGFYDWDLNESFTVRAAAGWETFAAKGTTQAAICNTRSSTECAIAYDYLGLEGSAHWNFINTGRTRIWVGAGFSVMFAMTKKNNIPNLSDSTSNQMYLGSLGADIGLKSGSFIPLVVEYGGFPGSSNVTASAIYVRGGYGFTF